MMKDNDMVDMLYNKMTDAFNNAFNGVSDEYNSLVDARNELSSYIPAFEDIKRTYETFMWRDYRFFDGTFTEETNFVSEHFKNLH